MNNLTKKQIIEAIQAYKCLKKQLICLNNAGTHSINLVAQKLSNTRLRLNKEEKELNKLNGFITVRCENIEVTIEEYAYGLYYINTADGIAVYHRNRHLDTLYESDIKLLEERV